MNMRMINAGAGPGVQQRHDADLAADILGISGKLHKRLGRRFHENGIERLLVPANQPAQLLRQGKHHMKIHNRQQFRGSFLQPVQGVVAVTFRARPVLAGTVCLVFGGAGVALHQVAAERFGPAGRDIENCPPVAWQHRILKPLQILPAVLTKNIGQLSHDCSPMN